LCDDERLYYLCDANFNVTTLVDTGGDAFERFLYDPYGNPTIYDGSWTNTRGASSYGNVVRYTGRECDPETGIYHYRHRYYAADLGRFVTKDPIGFTAGTSLYEYAWDSPTNRNDASGLQAWPIGGGWPLWPPAPPTIGDKYCGKCTKEQVDALLKDIKDIMDRTWVFPFWPGQCYRWAKAFEENLPANGFKNPCLNNRNMGWKPANAIGGGHAYYWFELDDGTIIEVDCWIYKGGRRMRIIPPPKRDGDGSKCCPPKD
jgi:RHS repeat-associated protein